MYRNKKIHIVIPFYNDSKHILSVIEKIPDFVDKILIVDDQSHEAVPFFKSEKLSIIKNEVKWYGKKGFLNVL